MPVERALVRPLTLLRKLAAHEEELLARMGPHETQVGAQVRVALPFVSRHLANQRALAVHHLVVAERQDEVLAEGIHHAESHRIVVETAVHRVLRHVAQRVVHPAHVPLVTETEPASRGGHRHTGPRGRFLRDAETIREVAADALVQALQERDGLEVLVAALRVGDPVTGAAAVIEVEHRGDRVDPQAVEVEFPEPEERVAQQVGDDLVAAVVEDQRVPVTVKTFARVLVLVETTAVEARESVRVRGEMRGHPVEQHADARLMAAVDEKAEIVRAAKAARSCVHPHRLVAPGTVEGMLGDGQQLDVCEAHLAHIGHELGSEFAVGEHPAIRMAPPRPRVHFVDADGRVPAMARGARAHPLGVTPGVAAGLAHNGGIGTGALQKAGIRIGFEWQRFAIERADRELVVLARAHARHEDLPETGLPMRSHGVCGQIPAVEVPDHGHAGGLGRPDHEEHAGHAVDLAQVCAKELPRTLVGALGKEVDVLRIKRARGGLLGARGCHGRCPLMLRWRCGPSTR